MYEIPVGPVHAGLIEPGHFRFSVVGETVLRLKARLWFVHRGLEKLFDGRVATGAVELAERVSGDTSAGHALAHSLAVEDALGIEVPDEVHRLRALVVELERLYNLAADLGALANDVGFSLANAHAQRIRERLLRINAEVTGHRLLRGAIGPGRVVLRGLPDAGDAAVDRGRPRRGRRADAGQQRRPRPIRRHRRAGPPTMRAPLAAWDTSPAPAASAPTPGSTIPRPSCPSPRPDRTPAMCWPATPCGATSSRRPPTLVVPSYRITHRPNRIRRHRTDGPRTPQRRRHRRRLARHHRAPRRDRRRARITRAKIVDPSWFNWPALPVAMADTIVPDFPLANKSFNLSYAGNDL